MDTVKLLWFFLWRMGLLGSGLGAVLGTVYGILVPTGWIVVAAATHEGIEPEIANAFSAIILGSFYGVLAGIIVSVPVGLILGGLGGLLLGILTRLFYRLARTNPLRYYVTAGVVCAFASVPVHFIVGSLFFDVEDLRTFLSSLGNAGVGSMVGPVVFVILPALIATLAMGLTGALVSAWYVSISGARVDG